MVLHSALGVFGVLLTGYINIACGVPRPFEGSVVLHAWMDINHIECDGSWFRSRPVNSFVVLPSSFVLLLLFSLSYVMRCYKEVEKIIP